MPFPPGWVAAVGKGPRPATGRAQHRIFIDSTTGAAATVTFADSAFIFAQIAGAITMQPTPTVAAGDETAQIAFGDLTGGGAPSGGGSSPAAFFGDTPPEPMQWSRSLRVINDGAVDLLVSFDGITIHDRLLPSEKRSYDERNEAGIALASASGTCDYRVIGW